MTNYLKAEKAVYKDRHPWKNYQPLTEDEKKVRRELRAVEGVKVSNIMDGKLRGKVNKI
jgi:hypothetical protein